MSHREYDNDSKGRRADSTDYFVIDQDTELITAAMVLGRLLLIMRYW